MVLASTLTSNVPLLSLTEGVVGDGIPDAPISGSRSAFGCGNVRPAGDSPKSVMSSRGAAGAG